MKNIGYLLLLSILFISGCAEIGSPPGGPEDKTAPTIASSIPENGSVNNPRDNILTIFFSEKLIRSDKNKNIYISPRPKDDPAIKWKSDRVNIIFSEPFEENQTYIISFSSDLKDRRNNPMDSSAQIAFSTGAKIAQGSIDGYVRTPDGANIGGMMVGLYFGDIFGDDSTYLHLDSTYPKYFAQTNQNGYFQFSYLPPGEYSVIGFMDKNRDERYSVTDEAFAFPDRWVTLADSGLFNNLILTKNYEDSSKLKIEDVKFTSDKITVIRLSKKIDLSLFISNPKFIEISSASGDSLEVKYILNRENLIDDNINLYTSLPNDSIYTVKLFDDNRNIIAEFDRFKPLVKEDKIKPRILSLTPDTLSPTYKDDFIIQLFFSEALKLDDVTKESLTLIDSDSALVDYEFAKISPFELKLTPSNISENKTYNLQVSEFDLKDMSSIALGDSLRTFNFQIYNSDSLGRLSGTIENKISEDPNLLYILTLKDIKTGKKFNLRSETGSFSEMFPAGKYLVNGYIDLNRDNQFTPGSYYSKRLSEPILTGADTVDVRARFETSGIVVTFK